MLLNPLLLTGELPFRGNSRMLIHQVLHDDPKPPRSLDLINAIRSSCVAAKFGG
jgi:hypothetical protein